MITSSGGISIATDGNVTITLGSGYTYLIAAYSDKQNNNAAVVWDITGIAAGTTIELPANVHQTAGWEDLKAGGKYGISTWSLFNDPPPDNEVPDGGLTVALLGSALTCLGLLRLKLG